MPLKTRLLAGMLLISTAAQGITFYTDVDVPASRLAAWRLDRALGTLGYCLTVEQLSSQRSLKTASTKPGGELVRVANIKQLKPALTQGLLRLEVPTVHVVVYRVTPLALIPKSGRFGIPQGVFILEQRYPDAMQVEGTERLFDLLHRQRIDFFYT